jgi:hypothetical protein
MRALIESEPGVVLDYVDAVDASTFEPVVGSANGVGAALTYIVAAHVGGTRLLDTVDVSEPLAASRQQRVRAGSAPSSEHECNLGLN